MQSEKYTGLDSFAMQQLGYPLTSPNFKFLYG